MTEQQGSYDVRGRDLDTVFATDFTSDRCLDALSKAQARFDPAFPGWALYRRLLTGDPLLDRTIEAYAIGMARGVARARKINGRAVVPVGARRNAWVAQAGRDGLDYALYGKFPCGLVKRGDLFGMRKESYQRVRDTVAAGIWAGISTFVSEAHYFYRHARSN
jgi:hypothetical protein